MSHCLLRQRGRHRLGCLHSLERNVESASLQFSQHESGIVLAVLDQQDPQGFLSTGPRRGRE